MPPFDLSSLVAAAPNIVTAVVFGFFVLRLLERQDKRDDRRDNEWRDFLADGRDQYVASVAAVAGEMKSLAATVGDVYKVVVNHDTWERNEMASERSERAAAVAASAQAVKVAAEVVASTLAKADAARADAIKTKGN